MALRPGLVIDRSVVVRPGRYRLATEVEDIVVPTSVRAVLAARIDRLAERSSLGWTLAGVAGASMMVLAGHPPTLFMAAVATGLYCVPKYHCIKVFSTFFA